jgi:hypothetical protein
LETDEDGIETGHIPRDILNYPFLFGFVKEHVKAHEFAHAIMRHTTDYEAREEEADYFASRLTGSKVPISLIRWIVGIETSICGMIFGIYENKYYDTFHVERIAKGPVHPC